jgi:hypothetical protein
MKRRIRLPEILFVLYFAAFFGATVAATSCGTTSQTLVKDAIGCGKQIPAALYTQIPGVFAKDDWESGAKTLALEYGSDFVHCAANDVLAILMAKVGLLPSTAAPEPLVLHLKAYVGGGK